MTSTPIRLPPASPSTCSTTSGAGDGFFSGFLSGWLRGMPLAECARRANAVGALVVSRHGCSPAMPSLAELEVFCALDPTPRRPADVPRLRQLHRRAGRPARGGDVLVLAIDHRWQVEEMADAAGSPRARLNDLKALLYEAFEQVAAARADVGLLVDDQYGAPVLEAMTGTGRWLARAIDLPRSRPVAVCVDDIGLALRSWPADQIAKLMVYASPDDPSEVAAPQWTMMRALAAAAASADRRYLIEFQMPGGDQPGQGYLAAMLQQAYERDITPDWWKLPPVATADEWQAAAAVIASADPSCEGMLVLGQTAEPAALAVALGAAASVPEVRGFAIGRAIFGEPARAWLRAELADEALVEQVSERFRATIATWEAAR
jgi:5-dehydro-2-deoxygluconokinase